MNEVLVTRKQMAAACELCEKHELNDVSVLSVPDEAQEPTPGSLLLLYELSYTGKHERAWVLAHDGDLIEETDWRSTDPMIVSSSAHLND